MKKMLLISFMILTICLVGCKQTKNEEFDENRTENQVEQPSNTDSNTNTIEENEFSNMSFEERTKEARDYMKKEYGWSMTPNWIIDNSQKNLIDNASIEKKDNYYILKLKFVIPEVYNSEDIQMAYNLAQKNGTNTFNGYTFYKDNKISFENIEEASFEEEEFLAIKNNENDLDHFYVFKPMENDDNHYYVIWSDFYYGSIVYEFDKELEVVLLPNDKITITFDRDLNTESGTELTVEEFYQKAINNEISSEDSIYGFEYNLESVGNSVLPWNNTNAVNFENGSVNVNFHIGGI